MFVTLFGIVTLIRLQQPLNADATMLSEPNGIVTYQIVSNESGNTDDRGQRDGSVTLTTLPQLENAVSSMLVTLFGIVTFVSPLHL